MQAGSVTSRRESFGALIAGLGAATLVSRPAHAVLGLGDGTEKEDEYKSLTVRLTYDTLAEKCILCPHS